jgi:DNA-binding NarL/FixJ family response regulator
MLSAPSVLILKLDNFAADSLRTRVAAVYPRAQCTLASGIHQARTILATKSIELLITGVGFADGDALDFLLSHADSPRKPHRTLVVTRTQPLRVLTSLADLAVNGVFDAEAERPDSLASALHQIETGHYWSATCVQRLADIKGRTLFRQLSPTEQLVLAVIGTGVTDASAAEELGMRPSAVQTVRRELHAKLGVHEKGDLIRVAGRLGFVRLGPDGVVSLGLGLLLRDYRAHAKRPVPSRLGAAYQVAAPVAA